MVGPNGGVAVATGAAAGVAEATGRHAMSKGGTLMSKRLAALGLAALAFAGAPALAAANVGVAMGGGTDVALETADAAVLKDRVTGVAELIGLSRATMANVKQNVAVAVGLKGVFLVTTLMGVTGLWPAILADTGATVLVTLNALRLLRWSPTARTNASS